MPYEIVTMKTTKLMMFEWTYPTDWESIFELVWLECGFADQEEVQKEIFKSCQPLAETLGKRVMRLLFGNNYPCSWQNNWRLIKGTSIGRKHILFSLRL